MSRDRCKKTTMFFGKQRRCESEAHDGGCHYSSFVVGGVAVCAAWVKGECRVAFEVVGNAPVFAKTGY